MEAAAGATYALDELGWLQFERLCAHLVEARTGAPGVFLLERWYACNAGVGETPPQLGVTWTELHPADELARADEWLALAQLLVEQDPAANGRFGFPELERPTLERLIDAATAPAAAGDEVAASVLRRIRRLAPGMALVAGPAAPAPPDWWVPADLEAPPSDEPATRPGAEFARKDVARVLRDL